MKTSDHDSQIPLFSVNMLPLHLYAPYNWLAELLQIINHSVMSESLQTHGL